VINEGDSVSARIIRIDPTRKRIGLSTRSGSAEATAEATAETATEEPSAAAEDEE